MNSTSVKSLTKKPKNSKAEKKKTQQSKGVYSKVF